MLTQPVTASAGGVVSSQWAAGWGATPLPPTTTDLALFATVILFMVLTVALAAVFVRDDPPASRREERSDGQDDETAEDEPARCPRRPSAPTRSGLFAAVSCRSRRGGV